MVKNIIFKNIKFNNINYKEFNKYIIKKGLFVFPAGPALATIESSTNYLRSIQRANFVFFDSGFFVILIKIFKNINVNKFSGYKFLELFFEYLKENKQKKIFLIDPNTKFSKSNKRHIKKIGIKKIYNYLAPHYDRHNLSDKRLLKSINNFKPDYIVINIGGGTQEVLGLYIKNKLKFETTILCTGAAISFFTRDQAPINDFIDRYYLGWLVRLIFNPFTFFKKYMIGLKLIPMVIFSKIKVIN